MLTVILVNTVAILFAYLAGKKGNLFYLKSSFFVLFLFLALRYNYGNDYVSYLDRFTEINLLELTVLGGDHAEPGWILLCRLFEPLGFFAMVAVLAAFNCFVYYTFVSKYVPRDYYWFALFIYTFDAQIMLVHSSAMRQSLAISIFLLAIDHLHQKNTVRYLALVAIAMSFHMSAFILLPVFLLGLFNWKVNTQFAVCVLATFVSFFVFNKAIEQNLSLFVNAFMGKYGFYDERAELGTGLGLLFYAGILATMLYYARFWKDKYSLLAKLSMLSYLIMPLGLVILMIGRLGMYFQPITLAVYPYIFMSVKNSAFKYLIMAAIGLMTLYQFIGFFRSPVWYDAFGTYQTIFTAPAIY